MFATATTHEGIDAAQDALLARMEPSCIACDDLECLDCAAGTAHDRCVHRCPHCAPGAAPDPAADIDWDVAWVTSTLITELRALDRVDRAVRDGRGRTTSRAR